MEWDMLLDLLETEFEVPRRSVTPTTRLADLPLDDLDVMEFLMSLEELFSIAISDDEYESLHTVEELVSFIRSQ